MNVHGLIPVSRIFGLLFLLPVIVTLGLAAYFYHSTKQFIAQSVACRGLVVEMTASQGEHGTLYSPTFMFTDSSGTGHRQHSSIATNPPAYSVGDSIAVRYDPHNPSDARVDTFWSLWLGSLICVIISMSFLLVVLILEFLIPFAIRRVWPNPVAGTGPRTPTA